MDSSAISGQSVHIGVHIFIVNSYFKICSNNFNNVSLSYCQKLNFKWMMWHIIMIITVIILEVNEWVALYRYYPHRKKNVHIIRHPLVQLITISLSNRFMIKCLGLKNFNYSEMVMYYLAYNNDTCQWSFKTKKKL